MTIEKDIISVMIEEDIISVMIEEDIISVLIEEDIISVMIEKDIIVVYEMCIANESHKKHKMYIPVKEWNKITK